MSAGAPPSPLPRRLGAPSAAALVIANMIGAGVFTTSGFALADLGDPAYVLAAWAVGGGLALCGAVSYGALARRLPESGGEYLFLSRTVHPLAGFLAGWISLLAGFTAPIAAAALALEAYLARSLLLPVGPEWVGTGAIVAAGLMHGLQLRRGVWLQNGAVALKLCVMLILIVVGLGRLSPDGSVPVDARFELSAFAVTLVWISFAYSGWNAAVYLAGEVRDPERNLQRSLVAGTALVTGIYLALNAVFVYAAPFDAIAGQADVGAIAAEHLGGSRLRWAVSLTVALALFTSISSMIMAGPRVYAQMAEDGLFPSWFRAGREVPGAAVALQAVLAIAVVWWADLVELLGYIGFTLGLSAAATVGALIRLRLKEGDESVPVPGFPFVPGLFVAATLAVAAFMILREPTQAALGLGTALTGVPVYWLQRKRAVRGAARPAPARSRRRAGPAPRRS